MQVSEFLLDTETGATTAKALADKLLVHAEAGSVQNKVWNSAPITHVQLHYHSVAQM